MKVVLRAGEARREVRILRRGSRLQVQFEDGRTIEATLLAGSGGVFELERGHDRVHGVGAALDTQARQVWVNGRTLCYQREQRAGGPREAAADGGWRRRSRPSWSRCWSPRATRWRTARSSSSWRA